MMRGAKRLFYAVAVTASLWSFGIAVRAQPKWFLTFKQIKVLETSRSDLERIMGNPRITFEREHPSSTWVEYETEQGALVVFYSAGTCSENKSSFYDVPRGIVKEAELNLKNPVRLSKFEFDLISFERNGIDDLPGIFEYRDDAIGFNFATNEFKGREKTVRKVEIYPSDRQERNYGCEARRGENLRR